MLPNYKSIIEFIKNNDDGVRKYTKKYIEQLKQKKIDENYNENYNENLDKKCMIDNVFDYHNNEIGKNKKVAVPVKYVDLHLYQNSNVLTNDELIILCKNIDIPNEHIGNVINVINKYNFLVYDVLPSFDMWNTKTFTFVTGKNNYIFDLILEKGMFSYKENYSFDSPYIRPYVLNMINLYNKDNKSYIREVDCSVLFEDHRYSYPTNLKLQNILSYMEHKNFIDYLYNRFGFIEKFADKLKSIDEKWNVQLIGNPLSTDYTELELFDFNIEKISCRITATIDDTDIEIIPGLLYMNGYDRYMTHNNYHLVVRPTYETIMEISDGNITIFEEWYKKSLGENVNEFNPIMVELDMDNQTKLLNEIHEYIRYIRGNYGFLENGKYYNPDDFNDIQHELEKEGILLDYMEYYMLYTEIDFGKIDMVPKIESRCSHIYINDNIDSFRCGLNIEVNRVKIIAELTYDIEKDPDNCYFEISCEKNKSIYDYPKDILVGPSYKLIGKYSTIKNELRNLITEITLLQ